MTFIRYIEWVRNPFLVVLYPIPTHFDRGSHRLFQPRVLLVERMKYFGDGSFEQQLDRAYKDFVGFCRQRKLQHSQPPFLPKHDP